MIDMTHRAHIRMGLGPLKLLACDYFLLFRYALRRLLCVGKVQLLM